VLRSSCGLKWGVKWDQLQLNRLRENHTKLFPFTSTYLRGLLSILIEELWHPTFENQVQQVLQDSKSNTQGRWSCTLAPMISTKNIPCDGTQPEYEVHLFCEYHFLLALLYSTVVQSSVTAVWKEIYEVNHIVQQSTLRYCQKGACRIWDQQGNVIGTSRTPKVITREFIKMDDQTTDIKEIP